MAKRLSVHAKVNIACDKEAEAGHIVFLTEKSLTTLFYQMR